MDQTHSQTQIELVVETPKVTIDTAPMPQNLHNNVKTKNKPILSSILTKFHAGYFRISMSLCSQALLWKILVEPNDDVHSLRQVFRLVPPTAFNFLWSLALFTLVLQSILFILRCLLHFQMVKAEFLHQVGVNYLFAPWISWLLLLQSSPFVTPKTLYYQVSWWVFVVPIVVLDVKIYGQWLTKGKRFLATVANPTSQLSVIGNMVAARAAAKMGWKESAMCMFSLGMVHYFVLFVTLYQRLNGENTLPAMLRPVFFLFIGAPSVASLAWYSINDKFDIASKMLFFLSLFLFMSLVARPELFRKSMKKFHVAWWAYSFPLTLLALAAIKYAEEVKGGIAHALMVVLSAVSVLVCVVLIAVTAVNSNILLPDTSRSSTSTSSSNSKSSSTSISRCDST
ncbi:S-type anion channel SLAH1-like [Humulus lupulus]|uniref:S-type anion channel SLAH1-like n=1 Tax=Humulus lupulus TaxID=3486 RepID=UPI002B411684|nr:S-type anion channel SLAH1-like [Humulus lupulus]